MNNFYYCRGIRKKFIINFFDRERAVSWESCNMIGSRSGQYSPIFWPRSWYIHTYIHKLYLSSDFSVAYIATWYMVTNYAKHRVKLQIERAKFQFVLIVFCNRAVSLFNFLIKKQWILTKAITVKANFFTQTKRIKRTTQCICIFDS